MKSLLILIALVTQTAMAGWISGELHVRDDNSKNPTAIFVNSYTNTGPVSATWHRVNVSTLDMPSTTKSVFLSGLLIISHGTTSQTCDLTIAFRAPGDTMNAGNYIGQTIEVAIGAGQRSTMATWAPVVNGEFEFQWNRNTSGAWPSECAYGINLSAQGYLN